MKRKFLILTLCFTLIFSSINYKKSYADGGVISLPILATVGSLAVASGIVIKNNDDLYDIGRMFYEYVNNQNDLTLDVITTTFNSGVTVLNNGLVSVDSNFLNIVKDFFNKTFVVSSDIYLNNYSIPHKPSYFKIDNIPSSNISYTFGDLKLNFKYISSTSTLNTYTLNITNKTYNKDVFSNYTVPVGGYLKVFVDSNTLYLYPYNSNNTQHGYTSIPLKNIEITLSQILNFPYSGGYTWDNVENKKEDESIALPIPGDLGQLVGQGSKDFWDNTDGLVGNGDITYPSVDNPSISVDNSISFPKVEDIPDTDIPDIDIPGNDTIIPSFPSFGDSLDFSPMYLTNVTEKFPFSLPWDIGRLIGLFDVDPVAPVFEAPMISESIIIDLTEFSELAAIVRFFVLIGFVLSLIFISTKLLG